MSEKQIPPKAGAIRVGVGGWTYEPWRETFFPKDLPKTKELEYASRQLTTIEINGTYYRTQSPTTFKKWARETPDNFVFSVKALRYTTNRSVLAEAQESVRRFLFSGLTELGSKLGPILWQFAPTKRFEREDFGAFLKHLSSIESNAKLRHALEVRHESFADPAFIELAREHNAAIVFADAEKFPAIADVTSDFIYARLQKTRAEIVTGYEPAEIDHWAQVARAWASGKPTGLPQTTQENVTPTARDVFIYMISGAKERAPAAAMAVLERLKC